MSTPFPVASLEVGSKLSKFLLLQVLGEGGMGMVWLAEDTSLGRNVALKVIRPEFAFRDDVRARFMQEARSAAQVEHERIVRILEVGEDRKVPYIAMELLKGQDLYRQLQSEPIPPLQFTIKVIGQVLQGLSAAHTHANRLIHRDIKPQNVWLETMEGKTKFRCKILDFGIAKTAAEDRLKTQTGVVIGTLDYMSPEQLNADELDPRSDLFSVGVMFYQMLTGGFPYRSRTAYQRGMEMRESVPLNPRDSNPKLPRSLSDFAMRLMAVNRDDRPASAKEAIQLLDTIIKNPHPTPGRVEALPVPSPEPKLAPLLPPEGGAELTRSRVDQRKEVVPPKRNRTKVFALLLGLVLLGGIIVSMSGGVGSSSMAPMAKGGGEKPAVPPEVAKLNPEPERKPNPNEPERLDCTGPSGADEATVKRVQQAWADHLGVPVETTVDLGDGVKMEFVLVPPGKFLMGGNDSDEEKPIHEVTLTRPFYLGKYEVTQHEYTQLTGLANPSNFKKEPTSSRHPVERVSWHEAKAVSETLSAKLLPKGFTKAGLPTEAQWEYTCRAGTKTHYYFGDVSNGTEANTKGKLSSGKAEGPYLQKTTPVGKYRPNALGLFDMHGNVYEWCLDGWDGKAYDASGRTDPVIDSSDKERRVMRSGCWYNFSQACRSSTRGNNDPYTRDMNIGFRLVLLP